VITDAAPSIKEELRYRQRRYAILMAVHIAGFALAGALYFLVGWRLGLALLIATGLLPWIAVVAANDRSPARAEHFARNDSDARVLEGDEHVTIDSVSCSSREWDLSSAPGDR
jgi:hypothetical protein